MVPPTRYTEQATPGKTAGNFEQCQLQSGTLERTGARLSMRILRLRIPLKEGTAVAGECPIRTMPAHATGIVMWLFQSMGAFAGSTDPGLFQH